MKGKGPTLRGELAVFGVRNVFAVDIKSEELLSEEDESSRLGSGVFGALYQGKIRRNEEVKNVALKVYKEELAASNASAVVEEVEFLRWVISRDNVFYFLCLFVCIFFFLSLLTIVCN